MTAALCVTAIAAVLRNGVIGADGDQPWRNRDDFARFRRLTLGSVLIMGRRTYDAIGKALPGRHTIVLTRQHDWRPMPDEPAVMITNSLEGAFVTAAERWPDAAITIAGGGEIYRLAWPRTTRLELTWVDQSLPGEVTFPAVTDAEWREVAREPRDGFSWVSYERRP